MSFDYEYKSNNIFGTINEFLNNYCTIRYVTNDKTYNENISNITPVNYNSNTLFLGLNENIKDATSIEMIIKLRSAEYVYKLK